ncbi:tetratricopeptide repeat protein, partial [Nonomuraea sp. NN258]|uniref:tetratricopeptide repeat protein n=1 Tax=Nonomuraea antri TaxID=2730852 RepID=UPI001568F37A
AGADPSPTARPGAIVLANLDLDGRIPDGVRARRLNCRDGASDGRGGAGDGRAAVARLLDHYLRTAFQADRLINPLRDPPVLAPSQPRVTPAPIAGEEQAVAWFAAEHPAILAAIELAASDGFESCAWQLAWAASTYLDRRGHWHDLAAGQLTALSCAVKIGDLAGQALSHRGVARAYARLDRHDDAHRHLRAALDLFARLGDTAGQAYAHRNLAAVLEAQGRDREALDHARRALELYRAAGHQAGLADALNAVGWFHARVGAHAEGLACCEEALTLYESLGDAGGQAQTWDSLGYAHHHLGDHRQAVTCYLRALDLYTRVGDRYNLATTFTHLGDAHDTAGASGEAARAWRAALTILTEIGHAEARLVADRLNARLTT